MESPQSPPPGGGPSAPPPGPQAPPPAPEAPPSGWEQPIAQQPQGAWAGRPLASWGSRLGAWFIDGLIVGVPATIVALVLVGGAFGIGNDDDFSFWAFVGASILSVIVFAILALIYAPATMSRQGARNGQTWGKQLLGIRVLRDNGEPMTFWWAALREVGVKGLAVGILSTIVPFIPWFLNYFWPLWDDQNRALHDMVVSTHVVRG